jgi:HPt (histidine-containing phosphotransfer) domain-containing protein
VTADAADRRTARLHELEHKMRSELPSTLAELRSLIQKLAAAPADRRSECQRELEQAAHRLRGRAAALQLPALCAAAAAVERLSMTLATERSLGLALARCEFALADLALS